MSEVEFIKDSDTRYSVVANNSSWGYLMLMDLSGPWGFVPSGMTIHPHWVMREIVDKLNALNIDFR
jgi:hypothetical protein